MAELTADQITKLKESFKYFDKDDSGTIDRKEMRETLKNLGEFSEMDIITILVKADANGSGDVDFGEFCKYVGPMFFDMKKLEVSQVEEAFKKYDTSGDGFIDCKEVVQLAQDLGFKTITEPQAKALIDMVDKPAGPGIDKDGKINLEEFKSLVILK